MAAALLLRQIQDSSSLQDADQRLRSQPASLEQLYAQTVEQMNRQTEGDAALGRKVLTVLLGAQEPVTTETLLDAVATDVGWKRTSDQAQVEQRIDQCVQCCGGLVGRSDGNTVRLIHATAHHYLKLHGVSNGS